MCMHVYMGIHMCVQVYMFEYMHVDASSKSPLFFEALFLAQLRLTEEAGLSGIRTPRICVVSASPEVD